MLATEDGTRHESIENRKILLFSLVVFREDKSYIHALLENNTSRNVVCIWTFSYKFVKYFIFLFKFKVRDIIYYQGLYYGSYVL